MELDDHDRSITSPQICEIAQLVFKVSGANQNSADHPNYRQAMSGPEKAFWREACEVEMANLERHGVYKPVPEDSLPSWNHTKQRASELVDMMWVLKKKYNEMRELLKYKARGTVRGDQGKAIDTKLNITPAETFAPTVRHNTCKMITAAALVTHRASVPARYREMARYRA